MCQSYIVISLCTLLTSYYFTQFLEATRTFFLMEYDLFMSTFQGTLWMVIRPLFFGYRDQAQEEE